MRVSIFVTVLFASCVAQTPEAIHQTSIAANDTQASYSTPSEAERLRLEESFNGTTYEVPDEVFLRRRCAYASSLHKRLKSLADGNARGWYVSDPNAIAVAAAVVDRCSRTPAPEEWMAIAEEQLYRARAAIECTYCDLGRIPRYASIPTGYRTYTMLLVPSFEWATDAKRRELADVDLIFSQFGESIGHVHGAIWFLDDEQKFDILRSQYYCDKFKLPYRGPYLVFLSTRPDLPGAKPIVVVRLDGISVAGVARILNVLTADLRASRKPDADEMALEELKQWLTGVYERHRDDLANTALSIVEKGVSQ